MEQWLIEAEFQWAMSAKREKPPYASAAIADAAFLRACSMFIAAMQRTSLKQPLKSEIRCQVQTKLSLPAMSN